MELERNAFVTEVEEFIKDSLATSGQVVLHITTPICSNLISSSEIVCWAGLDGSFNIEYECGLLSLEDNANAVYSRDDTNFDGTIYFITADNVIITIS